MSDTSLPDELRGTMARAVRLEYWNIFWTLTIIVTMGLVPGQSETMTTAWIEGTLGLVPPIMFLIAAHMERNATALVDFPSGSSGSTASAS